MFICENCEKEHDGTYGSGRFCSTKCSRGFSTKSKRKEINEKVSKSLYGRGNGRKTYLKICPECNKEYSNCRKIQVFCSAKCSSISLKTKEKIRNAQLKLVKEGKHIGWKSRKGKKPSYPEQYFIDLLNNENIKGWDREQKAGNFFIDFAFIDRKIALEIDGKQHQEKERKERDIRKDNYLIKEGWEVIRIKWFNPINDKNKEKLYSQINDFKRKIKYDPVF